MTERFASADAQEIWSKYQRGLDYGRQVDRFNRAEKCWRFFEGDQWAGIEGGGERLPFYNIIRPTVNYKKARIAMNSKSINLSVESKDEAGVMDAVNEQMKNAWEFGKMDAACWEVVETAMVSGTGFVYFNDGRLFSQKEQLCRCNDRRRFAQVLDGCAVFLGDEEERILQNQPYIIIEERLLTEQIRKAARRCGVSEEDVQNIMPDERSEAEVTTGTVDEQKVAGGYTTSILYMERTDAGIRFCRAVQNLIYQPFQVIAGLEYYPIVDYVVRPQKGKARGLGEVESMIPNQIEINRTLVRRSEAVKMAAFPKLIYDEGMIINPGELSRAGAAIAVSGASLNNVMERIGYLQAQPVSGDATNFENELISVTKELAGAGDAALGNINPEQASGAAITAVQDQADIPMNREVSGFYQMIEDIAVVWYHLIMAYNPQGYEGKVGRVSRDALKALCPKVEINVSSTIPDTVTARVNTLYNLLGNGMITFEEFMELVGSDSNIPIAKLKAMREEAETERRDLQAGMMEETANEIEMEEAGQQLGGMLDEEGANLFAGMMGG